MSQPEVDIRKVFLSSTFQDLVSYRKSAIEAIQRFGWFTVAMEDFISQDERPKELCLNLVRQSDLYVGIFAHRYGYIPEGDTQSITEQEYRCARNHGIKCFIFIADDKHPWYKEWIDRGKSEKTLLTLKNELKSSHTCSFFTTEENLAALLSASLARYTREELMKQLLEWSQRVQLPPDEQFPTIKLRVFRHPIIPNDVRCRIINESVFPTSVRTFLNAKIEGKEYTLPVPGHYAGTETWDIPARDGYEGHFDMEEFILKPAGLSYSELRRSSKTVEIRIDYSALTQSGTWHNLGYQRYGYDFANERWQLLI